MASPPLLEFLVTIPGLSLHDSLMQWISSLSQGSYGYNVVLSSQQTPLGIVRVERLLPYLLQVSHPNLGPEVNLSRRHLLQRSPSLEAPLSDYPELVESVNIIPADLTLEEAWSQISVSTLLLLVDEQRRYVGALAADKVFQFLASNRFTPLPQTSSLPSLPTLWSVNTALPPTDSSPNSTQATLVALLEQMPLPLMLQAGNGQTVFCNRSWLDLDAIAPADLLWETLDSTSLSSTLTDFFTSAGLSPAAALDPACDWSLQIAHRTVAQHYFLANEKPWQFVRVPFSQAFSPGSSLSTFPKGFESRSGVLTEPIQAASAIALACPTSGPDFWLVLALLPRAGPPPIEPGAAPKAAWLLELSHELKSPLTSLLGLSTLLKDTRLGSLNPRQTRYAELVQQSVRQLISTVNSLLDWFRAETGQLTLFPDGVLAENIGPQVLRSLQTTATPDGLSPETRFSWTLEPGLAPLLADPLRLQQMLFHLVSNALIHTPSEAICGLHIEQWGAWLGLTVWDQGPGLSQHEQTQLLQGCYEAAGREQLQRGAMGLGLLLTWHLVRLHGGDLSFTSSSQRGSQFTLLLPQSLADLAETNGSLEKPLSKTTLLLLACQTGAVIDAVVEALAATDYRVAIARSPAETLDKVNRLQPALVLMHSDSFIEQAPGLIATLARTLPLLALGTSEYPPEQSPPVPNWLPTDQIAAQLSSLIPQVLPSRPQPELAQALENLTVLYLTESGSSPVAKPALLLPEWLHQYHCRVLEVDDLAQADLLARVWQPQVVMLDAAIARPASYLSRLDQQPYLKTCSLVVLTTSLAQAAIQFPQLLVFACPDVLALAPDQATLQLLPVILQAARATPNR